MLFPTELSSSNAKALSEFTLLTFKLNVNVMKTYRIESEEEVLEDPYDDPSIDQNLEQS